MTGEAAGHGDERWQLDGDAAELYQRYLVPTVTAVWAADLVERVGLRRGERVLDVACGTGVVARAAAERVGRTGHVAGIDINAAMLAVARSLPAGPGASVGWFEGSAWACPSPPGATTWCCASWGCSSSLPSRPRSPRCAVSWWPVAGSG